MAVGYSPDLVVADRLRPCPPGPRCVPSHRPGLEIDGHRTVPAAEPGRDDCGPGGDLEPYQAGVHIPLMQAKAKKAATDRLRRIEGQIRGLLRMVEEDRYCIDVLTQLRAAQAALRGVEDVILTDHVAHCVEQAVTSGDPQDQRQKIGELLDLLARR
jgi:DNA-binding FrmR family transcriptional regulator